MDYELIAIPLFTIIIFYGCIISYIGYTRILHKPNQVTNEIAEVIPDYIAADRFIADYNANLYGHKIRKEWTACTLQDYREYLAYHFGKYPCGILPEQSATIIINTDNGIHTATFYNAGDQQISRYIKELMRIFKVKKTKSKKTAKVDVIAQAEQIVKQSFGKRIKELVRV